MSASTLASSLRAAGLRVFEDPGWKSRGSRWQAKLIGGKPVAVMHHHTTPPVPYPIDRLNGSGDGRIKCNINTKPDGAVWLVAYKACNYSSGPGISRVLAEVAAGIPPRVNAVDRGFTRADDDVNTNPFYFNFENDHPGDGSALPVAQADAITKATRVVLDHFGLTSGNVLSHAESTARKRDPYWNGDRRAIEAIRDSLEDEMTPEQEAKLDALLAALPRIPQDTANAVLFHQIRTGAGDDAYVRSVLQSLDRNEQRVLQLLAREDLTTITDADLTAIGHAVNDELARRAQR